MRLRKSLVSIAVAATLATTPISSLAGGIPVIDIAAITQLIQQIVYWKQQIDGMRNQLDQLKNTYDSLNGSRGMGGLLTLADAKRNYLPPDYGEIVHVLNGVSSTYAGLSSKVSAVMTANAVLSAADLSKLSSEERALIEDARRAAAMIGTLSKNGYQNTSGRFTELQGLIGRINTTQDPKAIAELQARIAGEQTMLANEQTKLQSLYYMAQAEQINQEQRMHEKRIAAHGSFTGRPALVFP